MRSTISSLPADIQMELVRHMSWKTLLNWSASEKARRVENSAVIYARMCKVVDLQPGEIIQENEYVKAAMANPNLVLRLTMSEYHGESLMW